LRLADSRELGRRGCNWDCGRCVEGEQGVGHCIQFR
jgi:hypothetical protein